MKILRVCRGTGPIPHPLCPPQQIWREAVKRMPRPSLNSAQVHNIEDASKDYSSAGHLTVQTSPQTSSLLSYQNFSENSFELPTLTWHYLSTEYCVLCAVNCNTVKPVNIIDIT